MTPAPTVGVVGLGLIGGSVARALVERDRPVVATTRTPEVRDAAAGLGVAVVDDVAAVVAAADVVVLAAPLSALGPTLDEVGDAVAGLGRGATAPTVTDVGSVKRPLLDRAAAALPDPATFVGGHPMAGTEDAGWAAARSGLFERRRWALAVDEPTALHRWAAVAEVVLAVGAEVVPVTADDHDEAVALVSHLPYALAAVAASLLDADPRAGLARTLAAGSFTDLTRVAGGHPTLGVEMAVANHRALGERLAEVRARLGALADDLDGLDEGAPGHAPDVAALFAAARAGREGLDRARAAMVPTRAVRLDRDGLVELGRRGGRVVGVEAAPPGADALDLVVLDPDVGGDGR